MSVLRVAIRQGLTRRGCVGLTEVDGQVELESADSCYLYNFHNVTKYFLDDGELCNVFDLTQAEDIKKRWQEYTEELYKKDLHNPDNHDGVITHLEPDTLECKVKWALGSVTTKKAREVMEFQLSCFKSLKMML